MAYRCSSGLGLRSYEFFCLTVMTMRQRIIARRDRLKSEISDKRNVVQCHYLMITPGLKEYSASHSGLFNLALIIKG